jgi:endoglucanase
LIQRSNQRSTGIPVRHLFAFLALLSCPGFSGWAGAGDFSRPSPVLLDFARLRDLPPGMTVVPEGPGGELCLRVAIDPARMDEYYLLELPLDIVPFRDHEILLSFDVKAREVGEPALPFHGIKGQLYWNSPASGDRWFNDEQPVGTFPWQRSALLIRVDEDATSGKLQLGLQGVEGTVWIANVSISAARARPAHQARIFRGHELPRLRGMVGPGAFSDKDFATMGEWKANVIRWRLINTAWARTDIPDDPVRYEPWIKEKLDELAVVLDRAAQEGFLVIVDLHSPPGGRLTDGTLRMVLEEELGEYFLEIWTRIAERFKGHKALWAYDLMNEPVQKRPSPPGVRDWWELQAEAARRVRSIDPETTIFIAADDWDSPAAFAWMKPVEIPRVVYTVHVYWPYEFTHQGLGGTWEGDQIIAYPGTFRGRPFDRDAIKHQLEPVREFQAAYGVHIFVGEFSVVRWAPGAAQFLADSISLFEEYGWDWTYHAFRESGEWSLEHADLPYDLENHPLAAEPSDRRNVVLGWMLQNQAPAR